MAEPKKPRAEAQITVVENLDQALGASDVEEVEAEASISVKSLLTRETFTWTSRRNKSVVVEFRRPPLGTREHVLRVLGNQSENLPLVRLYSALASITKINGNQQKMPSTTLTFAALQRQIGFVGPKEDDCFDEPVNDFVLAYELAMYPELLQARAEIEGSGLSVDDEARIIKNIGLSRPKA